MNAASTGRTTEVENSTNDKFRLQYGFSGCGDPPFAAQKTPVPTLAEAENTFGRRLADVLDAHRALMSASPAAKEARARDLLKAVERAEGPFAQLVEIIENPLQK